MDGVHGHLWQHLFQVQQKSIRLFALGEPSKGMPRGVDEPKQCMGSNQSLIWGFGGMKRLHGPNPDVDIFTLSAPNFSLIARLHRRQIAVLNANDV